MEHLELNILGCGSALPTTRHFPSTQVIHLKNKLYMLDCAEGAQIQFRSMALNFNRLNHIFLSHLHGDHCFGLPGLLSTLSLLGKTGEVLIHGEPDTEKIFRPVLDYFCRDMTYSVRFNLFNPKKNELIFEDKSLKVYTIPLKHRVPTCGYLFEELPDLPHLIREMIDFYQIPVRQLNEIKKGADFITPDGELIPNKRLTRPANPPKKYAYCSDTAYYEKIIPIIEGVDLLYHEATFCEQDLHRTKETGHSSAKQAAQIAKEAYVKKLMIGHFSSRYPDTNILLREAQEIFPEIIMAKEHLRVTI